MIPQTVARNDTGQKIGFITPHNKNKCQHHHVSRDHTLQHVPAYRNERPEHHNSEHNHHGTNNSRNHRVNNRGYSYSRDRNYYRSPGPCPYYNKNNNHPNSFRNNRTNNETNKISNVRLIESSCYGVNKFGNSRINFTYIFYIR